MEKKLQTTISKLAYRYRGVPVAIPLIIAVVSTWHEYENEAVTWAIAGCIFVMGFTLRIWAQQHLRFRLRTGKVLTTTGPYALVRNPIYIANTLICIALTFASEVLWLLPVTILACIVTYSLAVKYEESALTEFYGDAYIAYLHEVPRWLPRWSGISGPYWSRNYLYASVRAEAYNLLFIIPLILKELLH